MITRNRSFSCFAVALTVTCGVLMAGASSSAADTIPIADVNPLGFHTIPNSDGVITYAFFNSKPTGAPAGLTEKPFVKGDGTLTPLGEAAREAANRWNKALGKNLLKYDPGLAASRPAAVQIFVQLGLPEDFDNPDRTRAKYMPLDLACEYSPCLVKRGGIELNTKVFDDETSSEDRIDILTHEFGHALGLDHTLGLDRCPAIMSYSCENRYPTHYREISAHEVKAVKGIYGFGSNQQFNVTEISQTIDGG